MIVSFFSMTLALYFFKIRIVSQISMVEIDYDAMSLYSKCKSSGASISAGHSCIILSAVESSQRGSVLAVHAVAISHRILTDRFMMRKNDFILRLIYKVMDIKSKAFYFGSVNRDT